MNEKCHYYRIWNEKKFAHTIDLNQVRLSIQHPLKVSDYSASDTESDDGLAKLVGIHTSTSPCTCTLGAPKAKT